MTVTYPVTRAPLLFLTTYNDDENDLRVLLHIILNCAPIDSHYAGKISARDQGRVSNNC